LPPQSPDAEVGRPIRRAIVFLSRPSAEYESCTPQPMSSQAYKNLRSNFQSS